MLCVLLSASRAKLSMLNTVSKIRGQVKSTGYPQAEGVLGESMVRYGREMGEDTNFGTCVCALAEQTIRTIVTMGLCRRTLYIVNKGNLVPLVNEGIKLVNEDKRKGRNWNK